MNSNTEQMLEKLIKLKTEFEHDKDSEKLFRSIFIVMRENERKNSKLKKHISEIRSELEKMKTKIKNLEDKKI